MLAEMKRVLAGPLAVLAVLFMQTVASAQWTVQTWTDPLDHTKQSTYAFVDSKQPLEQFGRPVTVTLIVACQNSIEVGGSMASFYQLGTQLRFSEPVAIGERWMRWRVDDHAVDKRKTRFYDDGKVYYLSGLLGRDTLVPQLRNGKIMRIEADLPWAGRSVLEFDISGGAEAFAKIPCGQSSKPKGSKK